MSFNKEINKKIHELKIIYLSYQRAKHNNKGEILIDKPVTTAFSYSDYLCKIPTSMLIEKLDEAYTELKKHLKEELEDEKENL